MKTDKIVPTFCALPVAFGVPRPDGKMRTCTSNASSVQDPIVAKK